MPELKNAVVSVRHESFRDGGLFRLGAAAASAAEAAATLAAAREVLRQLAAQPVTSAQLETARQATATAWAQTAQGDEGAANLWLDADTYNLPALSSPETLRTLNALTPAEVQRVAARLFQHTPAAAVAVGNADSLRAELARTGAIEVFGEAAGKIDAVPAAKGAPAAKDAPKQPVIQLKRPW
jgi:predicted Zn-dependent peptidase